MTEAQKKFEAWYDDGVNEPLPTDYTILGKRYLYMGYAAAWQHQQLRIEELEIKLKIAVDALNEIARDSFVDSWQNKLAEQSLKQIEATS